MAGWRCLSLMVVWVDFFTSAFFIRFVVLLGLKVDDLHQKRINTVVEWIETQRGLVSGEANVWSHAVRDLSSFTLITMFECVFILFGALVGLSLFCYSWLLVTATEKDVSLKLRVTSAATWCDHMFQILLFIIFTVGFYVWDCSTINWIIVTVALGFIFIRALFLFIIIRFVQELKQCMVHSSARGDSVSVIVGKELKEIKSDNTCV